MIFHGFQKMTLLDFPGHVACTLFTAGCNFRCPFCHNALLVTQIDNEIVYSEEEILAYLKKRAAILDGVAITGGEPLMHEDLPDFIKKVRALGYAVKLDTNGSFPDRLKAITPLVDYVAMDIKNAPEKYAETIGVPSYDMSNIFESVSFLKSGAVAHEFRTTVVSEFHTPEDITAIARWLGPKEDYFLQNFVDSGNLICENLHAVPRDTLRSMAANIGSYVHSVHIRGLD